MSGSKRRPVYAEAERRADEDELWRWLRETYAEWVRQKQVRNEENQERAA